MPDRARPKGRTIKNTEERIMKLGAKGEKKKNRRCQLCGIADGHNSRTCLSVEENSARLARLANRKRGRPAGSRLNTKTTAPQWNETSTAKKHRTDEEVDNESIAEHMGLGEELDV
jgi:hypothetical protein